MIKLIAMGIQLIKHNFTEAASLLNDFISDKKNIEKIKKAGDEITKSLKEGQKIISCGNGGSMTDSMHFAEELTGRFRKNRKPIAAVAISDPSYITCTANDFGYEEIFSRYVEALGNKGDVLLAISTSGNSENVIRAANKAREKGMTVIGLTGKGGGKLAGLCHVEIRTPKSNYADRAQEIHIKIIHSLIHYIESQLIP